jgi:hypothetical protein
MCFDSSTKSDQLRTIETSLSYVHGQWCSQYHGTTIGDSPGHQTIRNSSSAFIILKILNIEERTTLRTAITSEMGVLRHALHHISVNEPPQLFTTRSIVFLINSVGLLPGFIETLIVMTTLSTMVYTEKLQWPGGLGALLLFHQHSPRTRCERVAKG